MTLCWPMLAMSWLICLPVSWDTPTSQPNSNPWVFQPSTSTFAPNAVLNSPHQRAKPHLGVDWLTGMRQFMVQMRSPRQQAIATHNYRDPMKILSSQFLLGTNPKTSIICQTPSHSGFFIQMNQACLGYLEWHSSWCQDGSNLRLMFPCSTCGKPEAWEAKWTSHMGEAR